MSSINRLQMNDFNGLWFKFFVSTLAMKILAKATAIFVPMTVPWVVGSAFHSTGMNFVGSYLEAAILWMRREKSSYV